MGERNDEHVTRRDLRRFPGGLAVDEARREEQNGPHGEAMQRGTHHGVLPASRS
jgi:hypothetical protein